MKAPCWLKVESEGEDFVKGKVKWWFMPVMIVGAAYSVITGSCDVTRIEKGKFGVKLGGDGQGKPEGEV